MRSSDVHSEFLVQSDCMNEIGKLIWQAALSDLTVLISGESGSGKEAIARQIHAFSGRASGPFVVADCSTIPEGLIDSELFGHAAGAFTSAQRNTRGLCQEANKGTLFVDQFEDMPSWARGKLLRVVDTKEVRAIGCCKSEPLDIRIIVGTRMDPREEVERGNLRDDLYYRLNQIEIRVPPLRERPEEIDLLAARFARLDPPTEILNEAFHLLWEHDWPGNVRELMNFIRRAKLFATMNGGVINTRIVDMVFEGWFRRLPRKVEASLNTIPWAPLVHGSAAERDAFIAVLRAHNGNRTHAARALNVTVRTVRNRIKKLPIEERVRPNGV